MLRRFWPLLVLGALAALVFSTGLHRYVSLDVLSEHYMHLRHWAAEHRWSAPLVFGLIYALAVALSIPGATIMTLAAGLMFGLLLGSAVVVLAATAGATAIFLAARASFGDFLRRRAQGRVARFSEGFRDDALSYLLVLRLVPLFPFWLVNLVPAFFDVPLRTYVTATALGILPASVVYVSVGDGLGTVLESGDRPDLKMIFEPHVFGPLIGLALLALLPLIYKRYARRTTSDAPP